MKAATKKTAKKPLKKLATPRRTQEARTAEARAKLIAAAITLICEKGFARTTMADIAALAGMTRGAIQHHFEGRVDLITTILHELESRVIDSFSAAAPSRGGPLEERIDTLIDGLALVCRSDAYVAAIDIIFSGRADPDLREIIALSVRRSSDHFKKLWQSTFGDAVSESIISDCRRVLVTVSRGLVMSQLFMSGPTQRPQSVELTLATAKQLIRHHMLSSAARPKPASRKTLRPATGKKPENKA